MKRAVGKAGAERGNQAARPLWICPRCGRGFANRNQSHACDRYDLEHHFEGKPPLIRELFDAFHAMLAEFGPVTVVPEKTRIAFQTRMSFAQLTPKQHWVDGHFVLARRVESPVIRQIETISPRNHVHFFRLHSREDIGEALRALAEEAYRVGRQDHLAK